MAYIPTVWTDEVLTEDARYNFLEDGGAAFKSDMQIVLASPVSVAGTGVTAARMNNIENRLVSLRDLAVASGKAPTFNKSITFDGTDATTMTFPSTSQSIPGLGLANTWTANQTVSAGAANIQIGFNSNAGYYRSLAFTSAGVNRFFLRVNNTAETGSNVGSDVEFILRDDAGAALFTPIFITRSTGYVRIGSSTAAAYPLDVTGDINSSTAVKVGGVALPTLTGANTWTAIQKISNSVYPVLDVVRTSAQTTALYAIGRVVHETVGDMADGFGAALAFEGTDSGASNKIFGYIGGRRDTADTEGALVFLAGTNGAEEFMRITQAGNVGIGMTPTYKLDVTGAMRVSAEFGCNNATPVGKYSIGAAASTDLATVIAQANKMWNALAACGIGAKA
jgi:hypothetical protein